MTFYKLPLGILALIIISCNSVKKESQTSQDDAAVNIVGAMKNVMWNGELGGQIDLDTISSRPGLYGLGPESFLKGELLINDGQSYVSRVTSDSTMTLQKTFAVSAPFFVYTNVTEWNELELPTSISTLQDLETFIDDRTKDFKRPFVFKVIGKVSSATFHIQNLPEGTKVSSPEDAHQGQANYHLTNKNVELIGFFSTEHQGIFTHHDSFMHIHLITEDESKMGHLDELNIGTMTLYLPKN